MQRLLLIALIIIVTNTLTHASGIGLKFPPTARSYALGESLVANSKTGAEAIYFNPAGLASINLNSLDISAYDGVSDISYNSLSYSKNVQSNTGLGISMGVLDAGKADIFELDGSRRSIPTMKDTCLTLAAGKKITVNLDAGLGIKFISSTLAEEYKANGFALDVGILYNGLWNARPVSAGVCLQNIGTGLKYETEKSSLPTNIRCGGAIKLKEFEFMAAANKDKKGLKVGLGVEYYPVVSLALMAGYKTGYDNQGLSLGFGLRQGPMDISYAYAPIKDLDSAHRVSLNIRFRR
ncbi:MAG: PorV/PorQ family protein [Candidatus Desantisbacteria bacterium]